MIKVGNLVKFELYGKKFTGEVIGILEIKDWDNKDLIGRNIYKVDALEDTYEVLEERIIASYTKEKINEG